MIVKSRMQTKLSGMTAILTWLVILISTSIDAQVFPPIGRHYAEPMFLTPPDSKDILEPSQSEVVDINGDGKDDIVYSGLGENVWDPAQLHIWMSTEDGHLELRTNDLIQGGIPTVDQGYRQIIPADFNGDGQVDLFLETHGKEVDCDDGTFNCWTGGQNSLLLSDNEGNLINVTATNLPAYSDFTHGSTVADFDNDGDIDIWVNNIDGSVLYDPGFSYLLFNDGEGKFTVVADNSQSWDRDRIIGPNGILPDIDWLQGLWSVAVDAEGDGDMDLAFQLLIEPEIEYSNLLLINDGSGHFSFQIEDAWPLLPPGFEFRPVTQHSLVYDLNGDNLDDLLLHQSEQDFTGHLVQVLISNGDGTFRDESVARFPPGPSIVEHIRDFQLHDLNLDGHKDLFMWVGDHLGYADIRVNDGKGFFRQLEKDWISETSWDWVVLDVDGDGGTDFFEWWGGSEGYRLSKMNLAYGPDLDGTDEDDRLIGGAHDNDYRGLEGNDVLDGGLGDDELNGGPGDDQLIPGAGADSISGGPGRDIAQYDFPIAEAEILFDEITFISNVDGSRNDQVETTEYALFSDAATPLPTKVESLIGSMNGVAGLWYDPELDGEGFNVITTPSGTVIFFYGFNADSERLWLISENLGNDLNFEHVFDLLMYEAKGGTFAQPAPSSEALSEWGRLKGLFDACGSGRFALHGADGVKTSYQTKLAGITNADCTTQTLAAPSGLAGLWYDPLLDGEGYNVIITETVTVILFYGYTADGDQLWLISDTLAGAPTIGEIATLKMFVSTDGTFDEPLASSEVLKDWGQLEITFTACGTAIANLSGDDGVKTSNLDQLAGIDHSTCP